MPTPDHRLAPRFDADGLHVLDPKDRLGIKSEYITRVQEKALEIHLPAADGLALDIGCGYGRLSGFLAHRGWQVVGIDPALRLLAYARRYHPNAAFCVGALPNLPVAARQARLVVFQNLLRSLLKLGKLRAINGCGRLVAEGGHLVVVENMRPGHPEFVTEEWILETFGREGFELIERVPIRAGRWWLLYLIRYGLIPRSWLSRIADHELRIRARESGRVRWRYTNVLFLFRRRAYPGTRAS